MAQLWGALNEASALCSARYVSAWVRLPALRGTRPTYRNPTGIAASPSVCPAVMSDLHTPSPALPPMASAPRLSRAARNTLRECGGSGGEILLADARRRREQPGFLTIFRDLLCCVY